MATKKWLWAGLVWLSCAGSVLAEYQENYESAEPTLRLVDADCAAELVSHQRIFASAHSGVGCERLVIRAGRGTRVYLEQPIPPAQVIDELKIRLWIKGNRPGFQLLARVVLPRSVDRRTGQPMTTLVWGTSYREAGGWQALTLSDLPKLVQRQVRVLSSEGSEPVDERQAYIDRIVINAYGGVGLAELLVDDLEIEGQAAPSRTVDRRSSPDLSAVRAPSRRSHSSPPDAAELTPARLDDRESSSRVHGSVLVAQGRPLFARGTLHGGESLAWLRSLGLNTVVLSDACGPEQRAIAEKLDLWLVVPRPAQRDVAATSNILPTSAEWPVATTVQPAFETSRFTGAQAQGTFDRVLAVLATTAAQESRDSGVAAAVGRGSLLLTRIPSPGESLSARSVPGDLFLVDAPRSRSAGNSRTDSPDPITRFASERPTWVLEDTDRLVQAALADKKSASPEQRQEYLLNALRAAMLRSIISGARGWCLTNALPESLPAADVPRWTAALEVAQRELELISPWTSAGLLASPLAAPAPGWRACALEANRSRLIIVTRDSTSTFDGGAATAKAGSGSTGEWGTTARQFTSASVARVPQLEVVDTGAPTSCDAYLLGETSLRPLERQRVAGGVRVRIEAPAVAALIVFTQDPLVVNYLARRGERNR